MAHHPDRPLSPHLSVYKWGPHMAVSIFHRATGDGLAIVGTLALLWWLGAMASGADAYAAFISVAGGIVGKVILIGLSWAFFQHMFSGLRHLVLDTGAGYELKTNRLFSILVFVAAIVATVALWGFIFMETI
jgi:succinate dehydrogenase / fumarate reductase cytochrome b subunit